MEKLKENYKELNLLNRMAWYFGNVKSVTVSRAYTILS
jgi:hypothetical protein